MIKKLYRFAVISTVVIGMGIGPNPAFAYSGNVIYGPGSAGLITRATTSPAITPELNQTYQRTMRRAMTQAAVAKAAVSLVRGIQVIATVATLVTLASDVKGIWVKNDQNKNDLVAPTISIARSCNNPAAADYVARRSVTAIPQNCGDTPGTFAVVPFDDNVCVMQVTCAGGAPMSVGKIPMVTVTEAGPSRSLADAEIEDLLKASSPLLPIGTPDRLVKVAQDLDDAGTPISFDGPDVEDMPKSIPIAPVTTTHPDGSKTIEATTLEPYRAPDGSVAWRKKTDTTEISKPDANGQTTTKTDTTTTDKGQSSTPDKSAPEAPATDTALPAQPVLYKQKYPDGLTGVYRKQRDAMANSSLFTLSKNLMPTVAMSGSCPVMPVNLTFSSWANFGTRDIAPPCQVWDWGKAICIVGALLVSRRLIFGG